MNIKNRFLKGFLRKSLAVGIVGIILLLSVIALPFTPVSAAPADAYWVGDGGNWSDALNHWGVASGGAPGAGNLPDATSNTHFDVNSFTIGAQTVTVDVGATFLTMNWTGTTNTPTLAGANNLGAYGSVTFISSMNITMTGSMLTFFGTGTFITAGNTLLGSITSLVNGITVTLGDDLACDYIAWQKGTLDTNGKTVTVVNTTHGFRSTYSNAQTITLGASVINASVWWTDGGTAILNADTSTIKVTGTGAFNANGETYNNVELNGTAHTLSGSNTFATLTFLPATAQTITFTDGTTQTVTTPTITGSIGNIKTLQGSGVAGWAITKAGGGNVLLDYMSVSRSTGNPVTTWYGGGNSTNGGNNTNWFFNDQPLVVTTQAGANNNLNGTLGTLVGTHNTSTWMEWGLTGTYGNTTPVVVRTTTGAFQVPFPAGFSNGNTYQYRFAASNDSGTYNGNNQTIDFSGAGYLLLRAALTMIIAAIMLIAGLKTAGNPVIMLVEVVIGIMAIITVNNIIG